MAARVLDLVEPQVCARYPGEEVPWQHRLLLHRVAGGRWIALTPDFDLEGLDLNAVPHRILDRGREFPHDIRALTYAFDPLGAASLLEHKRRARLRASILVDVEDPSVDADLVWVVNARGARTLAKSSRTSCSTTLCVVLSFRRKASPSSTAP